MVARIVAPVLLAIGLLGGGAAHAGLFDDEEARKAIVDLRQSLAKVEEQNAQRAAEGAAANAALLEQITALRRSLLDLNNQLETSGPTSPSCVAATSSLRARWPNCSAGRATSRRPSTSGCVGSSR